MPDVDRTCPETRVGVTAKPLSWPAMTLPPINLWNVPTQFRGLAASHPLEPGPRRQPSIPLSEESSNA